MGSFGRSFGFFKIVFVVIIGIILASFVFKIAMVVDAKGKGGKIYTIEVNTFNSVESYTTSEYERDDKSGCIRFKDEFGIKHTVCNSYTISEY